MVLKIKLWLLLLQTHIDKPCLWKAWEVFLYWKKKINKLKIEQKEIQGAFLNGPIEQEDGYYKLERVSNFWNDNYKEYESNDDRNKKLSLKEYLTFKP